MRWSVAALSLLVACSLVVDDDKTQCNTSADCDKRGSTFAGSVCSAQKLCVPCETNSQCSTSGSLGVCVKPDRRCAPLFSPECTELTRGPRKGEDARTILDTPGVVLVGALLKDDGDSKNLHEQRLNSVKLALDDVVRSGGIPTSASDPITLAALVCNTADEPLVRSAKHLVERLKVPAIVGPSFSGRVIKTATEVAIKGGTLLISPSATASAITSLDDEGLVWRTSPSDILQGSLLRHQVTALEKTVRAKNPSLQTVKLAVMIKDDAYGRGLSSLLVSPDGEAPPLLNGKPLETSAPYYRAITYPASGPGDEHRQRLSDFAPHIVVMLGTTETVTGLLEPLEKTGAAAKWNVGQLPEYLFADGGRSDVLLDVAKAMPALKTRVRITSPAENGLARGTFESAYQGSFGADPSAFGAAGAFDATYLVALSLTTLDGRTPTGALLSQGMGKLVRGESFPADFSKLARAFDVLRNGGTIDFAGASGKLDFDLSTGEAPSDIALWCVSLEGKARFERSGVLYDAVTGTIAGDFSCPN